jgi:hypothetical protein
MIEGSGSIPLTNGSGSGSRRPQNMWIRWIRIRNTGGLDFFLRDWRMSDKEEGLVWLAVFEEQCSVYRYDIKIKRVQYYF